MRLFNAFSFFHHAQDHFPHKHIRQHNNDLFTLVQAGSPLSLHESCSGDPEILRRTFEAKAFFGQSPGHMYVTKIEFIGRIESHWGVTQSNSEQRKQINLNQWVSFRGLGMLEIAFEVESAG